jgi:hypothetical protein
LITTRAGHVSQRGSVPRPTDRQTDWLTDWLLQSNSDSVDVV